MTKVCPQRTETIHTTTRRWFITIYMMLNKSVVAAFSLLLLGGCLGGPSLFQQDGTAGIPAMTLAVVEDADGILTGEFRSDLNVAQVISASTGDIAGSSIMFPPGALNFSTSISMQSGASMASTGVASSLGVSSLTQASSAVVVSAGTAVDASSPFTVQLSMSGMQLRRLLMDDPYARLAIVYKVMQANAGQKMALGVIPRSELTVVGGKVSFQTIHFGQFQAVYTEEVVVAHKQVATDIPIMTKAVERKLAPIEWANVSASLSADRRLSASTSVAGFETLKGCFAIYDRDRLQPWDRFESLTNLTNLSHAFAAPNDMSGDYYAAFECHDDAGRHSMSAWSQKVTIQSLAASQFRVVSTTPSQGATNVSVYNPVRVNFNKTVNTTTQHALKLFRFGMQYSVADLAKNWNANQSFVEIRPLSGVFSLASKYTLQLGSNLMSTNGNALANGGNISFTTRDGVWGDVAPVNTTSSSITQPTLATADNGNAIVAWKDGAAMHVYARLGPNASWTPVGLVYDDPETIHWSEVVISPSGNRAVLAFTVNNSLPRRLMICTISMTPLPPAIPYTCTESATVGATAPSMAAAEHVAYVAYYTNDSEIKTVSVNFNNGSVSSAEQVGTTVSDVSSLKLATNTNGRAILVITQSSSSHNVLFASRTSEGWPLTTLGQILLGETSAPQIAAVVNSLGESYIAFKKADNNVYVTKLSVSNDVSNVLFVTSSTYKSIDMQVDKFDGVHIAWIGNNTLVNNVSVFSLAKNSSLSFGSTSVFDVGTQPSVIKLAVSADGKRRVLVARLAATAWKLGIQNDVSTDTWDSDDALDSIAAESIDIVLNMDEEGNANVLCAVDSFDGVQTSSIYTRRSLRGASDWQEEEELLGAVTDSISDMKAMVDRFGRISLIWKQTDGTYDYLKTRLFQAPTP